ncbi:MAG: deoxynucleoside kinase [Betaproteobacteria bacterium]|nr:deoxynucleoside kinase [Betaproteobacteria bacterium]
MTLPERLRYIVVEGPIGAGKTTLARRVSAAVESDLLLEDPEQNPFLGSFYIDPQRHALATQLFFLFQRVNQVSSLKQRDLFEQRTVSDFLFDKDALFAQLTLAEAELGLYQQIYQHLAPQVPAPDLVIYLQAPVSVLMDRVRRRGKEYEKSLSEDYLRRLSEAYSRYFHEYAAAPLLIVNSTRLNFVDREEDFALLLRRITDMRGSREFFNLGA